MMKFITAEKDKFQKKLAFLMEGVADCNREKRKSETSKGGRTGYSILCLWINCFRWRNCYLRNEIFFVSCKRG